MQLTKNKFLTIFLIVQVFFVKWIANYPSFIEKFYSNGFYKYISKFLRFLFGWLPFSVGDVLYFIIIIWILKGIFRFFKKKPKGWSDMLFGVIAKLSIVYFMFHLFWGFNYYRVPLQQSLQLEKPKYNIDDLNFLTEKILIKTQESHFKITKNGSLPVQAEVNRKNMFNSACNSYVILAKKYPQFEYKHSKVKKSLFSLPLTYMGFSGYLNPFTNEAQVNYKVPEFMLPTIATHEIAHQLGYASETEANFIAFLASTKSDDLRLNYSGYVMALRYCLSEIYNADKNLYFNFYDRLPLGVKKNLNENREFWSAYKNPVEPVFKTFYDLFLKSNNQKKGIRSYGRMVGLIMAYEKTENL